MRFSGIATGHAAPRRGFARVPILCRERGHGDNGGQSTMTGDEFRDLALGLPGAVERAHMGHPDFRVKGRIFATLRADERGGVVRLAPEEQRELMRAHPRVFSPAPGAWDARGGPRSICARWIPPPRGRRCCSPGRGVSRALPRRSA